MKSHFQALLATLLGTILLVSCQPNNANRSSGPVEHGNVQNATAAIFLDSIKSRGYLTAIMDNSTTSLFLYRGQPLGFEYELISQFAESMGVELRFLFTRNLEEGFEMLNEGKGDILAHNLTITYERREIINFSDPHYEVRQMLIQRNPDGWRKMKLHEIENQLIRNPLDLGNKEVHVRSGSSYVMRLKNLSNEIGQKILIIEESDLETEDFIEMVAHGEINYSVADENIVNVFSRYYSNVDMETAISFPQQIAWGLRKNSDTLKMAINEWLAQMKSGPDYNVLYNKYFKNSSKAAELINSEFFFKGTSQISPYDSLIKVYAKSIKWDWKLLAAQISKESKFDPRAKSWVGAIGLMQVMPRTGMEYGIKNLYEPDLNLQAGTQHIVWLEQKWLHIEDPEERLKFVLASYNVGDGHVRDAVKLTEKYGGDPTKWDGQVEKYVLAKSKRKYYEDPVVNFGYCRGNEPVQYVQDILNRYNQYQQMYRSID